MKLVFLLEEASTKAVLDVILPKVLPPDVSFETLGHNGKSDLRTSLPMKLQGWNEPDVRFVIVQDQDSSDCLELKSNLQSVCDSYRENVLVRIACREMEAWYFGDLKAVSLAYSRDLTGLAAKRRFRIPDAIVNPKDELRRLIPGHQQIHGARLIAQHMDIRNNSSHSFNALMEGIARILTVGYK
jgi:hypothetical protein